MPHVIGIDIVEIKRFAIFKKGHPDRFLKNNFTPAELAYCFAFKDAAPHLAGTFAAKEAVFKALPPRRRLLISSIEIRRGLDGRPGAWLKGRRIGRVSVSITHTAGVAAAVAIKQ